MAGGRGRLVARTAHGGGCAGQLRVGAWALQRLWHEGRKVASVSHGEAGSELTVPSAAHVLTPPVPFADEVTFDGVACEVAGRRVAGTAAILWGPERNQPMSRLAVATVALPHMPQAPEAEAWGGRLALTSLLRVAGQTGQVPRSHGNSYWNIRWRTSTVGFQLARCAALDERGS